MAAPYREMPGHRITPPDVSNDRHYRAAAPFTGGAHDRPVLVGDEVSFYGEVLSVGRTSLRVRIEA